VRYCREGRPIRRSLKFGSTDGVEGEEGGRGGKGLVGTNATLRAVGRRRIPRRSSLASKYAPRSYLNSYSQENSVPFIDLKIFKLRRKNRNMMCIRSIPTFDIERFHAVLHLKKYYTCCCGLLPYI